MSSLRRALAESKATYQQEQQQQQELYVKKEGNDSLNQLNEQHDRLIDDDYCDFLGADTVEVKMKGTGWVAPLPSVPISSSIKGGKTPLPASADSRSTAAKKLRPGSGVSHPMDDALVEDRPSSRLSTTAASISSAASRAGTALSRATTAVIRAATPFRFLLCKRRHATTTVVIKAPPPTPHVIGISPHLAVPNTARVFLQGTYHDGEMKGSWADTMGCDGECTCKWVWKLADYDGKYICEGKFELDDGNKTEIMEWVLEFTLEKNTEGNYNLSGNGSNQFGEYSLFGVICQDRVTVERVYLPVSSPEEEEEEEEKVECWRHDHTVLGEGVKVLVRWNVNERYTGTVLAYDAETGKHLIRYDEDGVDELVDLAVDGYDLLVENDGPIEDEDDDPHPVSESDFSLESASQSSDEEIEFAFCHKSIVLNFGVKVLVRWNVNERYTGTVLAYDAETGKHLIRYDKDAEEHQVDLAGNGYLLLDENDNPIESEEDESLGGHDVSDSDFSLESAEFDAPPKQKQTTQKKKQTTQKKKQSPTQKKKQSPTQKQKQTTQKERTATRLFIKPRNRKVGAFDDTVIRQNATITRCNTKLHEGNDKCICDTCKTNAADYNNSVTLQGTTDGEGISVKFYTQIEPSIREALDFDPKFREKYNKVVAFREEEKGVMLKFGVIWINCYKGHAYIPNKCKAAAEKIPITVNGTTFEHMLHVDYKECRNNAWREYSLARKELLERLVTEGCKAGREKTELFKLIAEFDMNASNKGKDFNIENRHFQSPYTNEMVAEYIELSKKEHKSAKEKQQMNSSSSDIQYSIAFDTLVVLMKAAVNAETKAGQILLRYWKHEIIQKYFRQLSGRRSGIKSWERSLYSHKMTVEWVKEVLQLKFVRPTELDAIVDEDAGEL